MNSVKICVSLCALAMSNAMATASPTDFSGLETITFETGTTGLPAVDGVNFLYDSVFNLPTGSHWFYGVAVFGHMFRAEQGPFFGQQLFGNVSGGPGHSDLGIRFDAPVQAVGAWVFSFPYDYAPASVEFVALTSTGNVLDSRQFSLPTSPDAFSAPEFYGFISPEGANISQVEWRILGDTNNSGFFGVDNISFGTIAAVPESPMITLFGIGLIGSIFLPKSMLRKISKAGRAQ